MRFPYVQIQDQAKHIAVAELIADKQDETKSIYLNFKPTFARLFKSATCIRNRRFPEHRQLELEDCHNNGI